MKQLITEEQIVRLATDVCGSSVDSLGTWHSMGCGHSFDPSKYADHNALLVEKFTVNVIEENFSDDCEFRIFARRHGWVCLTVEGNEYESDKWKGCYSSEKGWMAICLAILAYLDSPCFPTEQEGSK